MFFTLVSCLIWWKATSSVWCSYINLSIFAFNICFKNRLVWKIFIHSFYSASLSVIADIIVSSIYLSLISLLRWFICFFATISQNEFILWFLYICFSWTVLSTLSSISLHLLLNFILFECYVLIVFSFVLSLINATSLSKYLFLSTNRSFLRTSFIWRYTSFR